MGSGGGSSGSGQTYNIQNQTNDPWAPQQGYLLDAFNSAQGAYNQGMATGPYAGNYVAPQTGQQADANNNAYNWAMGTGSNTVGSILGMGGNNAQTGFNGATGALGALGTFAGTNQTQNNIDNAGKYADNPYIGGMVDSAMHDAVRTASESTIPNIYRSAAGSGNINSDRAALAQGVVDRGLGEQAGNISANLRGNAYEQGINQALQGDAQGLQALSQEGSLGENMGQSGLNALSTGINDQGALVNQATAGANANYQQANQNPLLNALQQYQGTSNFPWQQLQNYYNIIGNRSWGSQTTGTSMGTQSQQQQTNPSMMSTIGGGLGILGALLP
jgi:hypothetical protein